MRTCFLWLFILVLSSMLTAQIESAAKYRITFKDKKNSPYTFSKPEEFLSQRAIERRIRYGISLDSTDIPVNKEYIDGVLKIGGTLLYSSKWFNFIVIYTHDTTIVSQIKKLPYVKEVVQTYPLNGHLKKSQDSNLESFEEPKSDIDEANVKFYNYGLSYHQNAMIGIPYLHSSGYRGEGIILAMFDAGFYRVNQLGVFDSVFKNNQILGTKDFVRPGGDVYNEDTHGMSCFSLIAANSPGKMIGTAPKAKFWLLRTEDAGTEYRIEEDNWIAAAEFADSAGVDIINSSLGYTTFWDTLQNYSYKDMDGKTAQITKGAEMAFKKGMLVVNSAGNSGADKWKYVGAPADGPNVLSVGAVDAFGRIARFSSRGPTYDKRIKPNVVALGRKTYTVNINNDIEPGDGTSFSSPIIAGAAACLWQVNRNLTNKEIKEIIEKSANLYPFCDTVYGCGLPNFTAAYLMIKNLETLQKEDPIKLVYPTPFENELFILFQAKKSESATVEIINSSGRKILAQQEVELNVGFNNLMITNIAKAKKGVYILRIKTSDGEFTKKIVK